LGTPVEEPLNFIDALIEALRQVSIYNKSDQAPPAA